MNQATFKIIVCILMISLPVISNEAQDSTWTFDECIHYALSRNIDIQKAELVTQQNEVSYNQTKYNRLPSVEASVSHNTGWEKNRDQETNEYGPYSGSSSMNYGINSSVKLFNGFKINTQIKKSQLDLQSGKYYSQKIKESIELNILEAYLSIMYAQEEVNNAYEQLETTQEQLTLAKEKMNVGIISKSDYLQIESEYASEKLTLANANSSLTMAKVNLMQLMELPVTDDFTIATPDVDLLLQQDYEHVTSAIYSEALEVKPEIKEAKLNTESVKLDQKIARADLFPSLNMSAGASTGWSDNITGYNYSSQLENRLAPYVGVSMNIPIFQKNQVKTNITSAKISYNNAILEEMETKNNLRKVIEQAVVDANTARAEYQACIEQYEAIKESYQVAENKFELGLINSVEFLIIRNDLIMAESNLLQSKFKLIYSHKVIDFYKGSSVSLTA